MLILAGLEMSYFLDIFVSHPADLLDVVYVSRLQYINHIQNIV